MVDDSCPISSYSDLLELKAQLYSRYGLPKASFSATGRPNAPHMEEDVRRVVTEFINKKDQ